MRRLRHRLEIDPTPALTLVLLVSTLLHPAPAAAQTTGVESNVLALEKAAMRPCRACSATDPKLLITYASAAIRMDQEDDGDTLYIQVIPLKAKGFSVSEIQVDGVAAELAEGRWVVERPAKARKKSPKVEITCGDGQELTFKPQHRPHQGPVGGLIMPKKDEAPEADLSFHKKSFWADSLG